MKFKHYNRECSRAPKAGKHWCDKCDRDYLGSGEKCSLCGNVSNASKCKKQHALDRNELSSAL